MKQQQEKTQKEEDEKIIKEWECMGAKKVTVTRSQRQIRIVVDF